MTVVRWLRSALFTVLVYAGMAVLGITFAPFALFSRGMALRACKAFCVWTRWLAVWLVGIKTEVRGTVPTGEVLVASKHQSFLDVILIFHAVPRAKFIMKKELLWAPFLGLYARRVGCIPIDRAKRGTAIARMVKEVAAGHDNPGQLIIYPQGTRVAPGDYKPYKIGSAVLYEGLHEACYPVATNVGLFWPRKGMLKSPGVAVVEFLDPIPPGRPRAEFLSELETRIETRSAELMLEAGFSPRGSDLE